MSARDDFEAEVWRILTAAHIKPDDSPLTFAAIIEAAVTCATFREPCTSCRKPRPEHVQGWAHGYCSACYKRWVRRGRPKEGPPPPGHGRGSRPQEGLPPRHGRYDRLEDYADLRSWGVPDEQAAERLRVSVRTVERYKRAMAEAS